MTRNWRRVAVVVVAAGAPLLVAIPAEAAPNPVDPMTPITSSSPGGALSNYGLTFHDESSTALTNLDAALPNVSLTSILTASGASSMTSCAGDASAPINPAPNTGEDWCLASADQNTSWAPQGITTSGDFDSGDGMWGAYKVIALGEHYSSSGSDNDQARVAWIDDTGATPTYHWASLMQPTDSSGSNFKPAIEHVGGMVWLGNSLWVTGHLTSTPSGQVAIAVFDFAHMYSVTPGAHNQYGLSGGTWYGNGAPYVMMLSHYYTYNQTATCAEESFTDSANGSFCPGTMSVDKTTSPESVVMSEYLQAGSGADATGTRMLRYNVDTSTLLLSTSGGVATPVQGFISDVANQQGVLSHHGLWMMSHSSGSLNGQLFLDANGLPSEPTRCSGGSGNCFAVNPEALTYWAGLTSPEIWSASETAGHNQIFGMPADKMFWLRTTTGSSTLQSTPLQFGQFADQALSCDWNNDGVSTFSFRRGNVFHIINSNADGASETTLSFGNASDIGICGDWDGSGGATVGVYRQSNETFYLKNVNDGSPTDITMHFAGDTSTSDVPIVGDWDGNGTDTVGYRIGNAFHISNTNATCSSCADASSWSWGNATGDVPVAGDWDNNGSDTMAIYRTGTQTWFFANALNGTTSSSLSTFGYNPTDAVNGTPGSAIVAGDAESTPVAGRWTSGQASGIGLYQGG
ncbi:MAG TPA: hypothetical protein VFH54_10085 [Mycobacteriales bacterium]|nr:hypothetical protein [Mycobacteriales bacterium]